MVEDFVLGFRGSLFLGPAVFCFLSWPVSIGFHGNRICHGRFPLAVCSSAAEFFVPRPSHTLVWRYSSRQRMAGSFLAEQTLSSCCSLHGGYLSHVFVSIWCFPSANFIWSWYLESRHTSGYLKRGRHPVLTGFFFLFFPSGWHLLGFLTHQANVKGLCLQRAFNFGTIE